MHVERQIGECDLGLGAGEADSADVQAHFRLLVREHVLDAGPDLGFGGVAAPDILRHRTALGLPAMDAADPALCLQPTFVALAAVGGIGPDVRGGVVARHHIAQHAAVIPGAVGDLALADEAEGPADRDAAFVSEARDRNIRLRPAIGGRPGLGELQRPAGVGVFLPRLGGLVRPYLGGGLALLHRRLLGLGVTLFGCRHQRGIDDLPAHRQITPSLQLAIKIGEHGVERAGGGEPLAEHADRVRIRRRRAKVEAQETQPAQPVADQPFHAGIGHVVLRGQDQHLQHHHRIIRRTATLGAVGISQRGHQRRPKHFEVHHSRQYLQRIAVRRKPLHVVR